MYGSHTARFSNEGPSWGVTSLPCKEVSLLGDIPGWIPESHSRDLFHVPISSPFFQRSPCQSQSHKRSKMRACTSASPSRAASLQPSQEALQHLLSAAGSSVCPLLLSSAPHPVFGGWPAHARCRISKPKLNNPTKGTADGSLAKQQGRNRAPSPVHPLQTPSSPAYLLPRTASVTGTDPCDASQ